MDKFYYKIDVRGYKHGYSFMVSSTDKVEDDGEVIDRALDKGLFNDETDADYAEVDDLLTQYDIDHFTQNGCCHSID